MKIIDATSLTDILNITKLADAIWKDTYKKILSYDQIEYMLNKYLSVNAINENILEGYEYKLININNTNIGFIA